jgi:hypothetical protein
VETTDENDLRTGYSDERGELRPSWDKISVRLLHNSMKATRDEEQANETLSKLVAKSRSGSFLPVEPSSSNKMAN